MVRSFIEEYRARVIVFESKHMKYEKGSLTVKALNVSGYDCISKGTNDMYEWYGNGIREAEALWHLPP